MEKILSSKIFYAIVLGLAVVGFSYIASRPDSQADKPPSQQGVPANLSLKYQDVNLEELVKKDSDGDNVPDWEEALWGTSPSNFDTYGKGLGDRREIDNKKTDLKSSLRDPAENSAVTATDAFSRQLFSSVMALKQSGNFTETTLENLSSSITNNLRDEAGEKIYYVSSDLKLADTATSSIVSYGENTVRIAKKYEKAGLGNELLVIASAIDKQNPDILKKVGENITVYRKLLNENLDIAVPKDLSQNHLVIVNGYRNVIESLGQIERIFSDPIAGLIEVTRYRNSTSSLLLAFGNIERYFANRGIVISK